MGDLTEAIRKIEVAKINSEVESNDKDEERTRLEKKYGQVWNTEELSNDFRVQGFMAPFIVVTRKSDNSRGSLEFQHNPRFYFNFREG